LVELKTETPLGDMGHENRCVIVRAQKVNNQARSGEIYRLIFYAFRSGQKVREQKNRIVKINDGHSNRISLSKTTVFSAKLAETKKIVLSFSKISIILNFF
jgi:hypothetical protein